MVPCTGMGSLSGPLNLYPLLLAGNPRSLWKLDGWFMFRTCSFTGVEAQHGLHTPSKCGTCKKTG